MSLDLHLLSLHASSLDPLEMVRAAHRRDKILDPLRSQSQVLLLAHAARLSRFEAMIPVGQPVDRYGG
jgi:hypothetical protein